MERMCEDILGLEIVYAEQAFWGEYRTHAAVDGTEESIVAELADIERKLRDLSRDAIRLHERAHRLREEHAPTAGS